MSNSFKEIEVKPDLEAECAVLGSILIDSESLTLVADWLKVEHFQRDAHRTIYEAMLHLYEKHEFSDAFTICELLRRWDRLKDIPGESEADSEHYIGMLINHSPASYEIERFAKRVKDAAIRKRLVHSGANISFMAWHEEDVEEALVKAEAEIHSIVEDEDPTDVVPISQVATDFYDWLNRIPVGGAIVGVPTGLDRLNDTTGGLQKSDLIVIAARPGVGKTSLALTIARNAAIDHERGVLIFSLEMSRDQLFQRLTALEARVNLKRLRMGQLTQDELDRVVTVASDLGEAPIWIDHTPALSLAAMRSRIRRTLSRHDIDLIVVDYLQKMTATIDGKRIVNSYQEVSEIAKGLKDLAREFNVPVLTLCQLSRAVEGRQNHIPQLSDLRESGAIEQESDIVAFIYRDDYYQGKDSERPKTADIIFAKHRNGETTEMGDIQLGFEASETRFYNLPTVRVINSREEF